MLVAALLLAFCQDAGAQQARPVEYWRGIARSGYAVPEGESAFELLIELSQHLGARDSELRDDLGYGIPVQWILRQGKLDGVELAALAELWSANLRRGIGARGDDSVLLRSFSALDLSLIAAVDAREPVLEREAFDGLLEAALEYLAGERDLRGWNEDVGWIHATAHTADLLKFLARSKRLTPDGQAAILEGIARRLADTDGVVFVHGEEDRLTAAVVSVLAREDLDLDAARAFVKELGGAGRPEPGATEFDPVRFAAGRNALNALRALYVRLAGEKELSAPLLELRTLVLETLSG